MQDSELLQHFLRGNGKNISQSCLKYLLTKHITCLYYGKKKKNSVDYLCLPVTEQQQFLMLCHPRMRCIHSISTFYIEVYPSLEFQSSPRRYVVAWNVSLTNLHALNLISPVRQTRFDSSQPRARAPSLLSIDSFHRRKINVFTFSGIRWLYFSCSISLYFFPSSGKPVISYSTPIQIKTNFQDLPEDFSPRKLTSSLASLVPFSLICNTLYSLAEDVIALWMDGDDTLIKDKDRTYYLFHRLHFAHHSTEYRLGTH